MVLLNLIVLISLIPISLSANVDIIYSPESIILQNTTEILQSSDLSKFLKQCLGYTTKKPNWNGFFGYKNIAKNIPQSIVVFHMPISMKTMATHTFPFEIDSDLKQQYLQTKEAIQSRNIKNNNVLAEFVELYDQNDKNSLSIESELDSVEKFLNKIEPNNGQQHALLWFEMLANKDQLNLVQDIEERFQKILNHLKYLFGNNLLVMSIYDENQMAFERGTRQSAQQNKNNVKAAKERKVNLAHDYDPEFHSSFVSIGFAALLFILAVFVISVSLWNIDPGRDSIIYRLTAQKMKKDQ